MSLLDDQKIRTLLSKKMISLHHSPPARMPARSSPGVGIKVEAVSAIGWTEEERLSKLIFDKQEVTWPWRYLQEQ